MSSSQWSQVKWAGIAVAVPLMVFLATIGATMGTFIVLGVIMVAAAGVWRFADKQEGEAKARELSGR